MLQAPLGALAVCLPRNATDIFNMKAKTGVS
jgi:hypothetical protein